VVELPIMFYEDTVFGPPPVVESPPRRPAYTDARGAAPSVQKIENPPFLGPKSRRLTQKTAGETIPDRLTGSTTKTRVN
jgi:hypothetical protein